MYLITALLRNDCFTRNLQLCRLIFPQINRFLPQLYAAIESSYISIKSLNIFCKQPSMLPTLTNKPFFQYQYLLPTSLIILHCLHISILNLAQNHLLPSPSTTYLQLLPKFTPCARINIGPLQTPKPQTAHIPSANPKSVNYFETSINN